MEWDFTTEKIWNGTLCNDVSASADRGCEGCILIRKIFKKLARVDISENSVAEIRSPINVQGPAMFILWPENSPIKTSKRFQLFPSNGKEIYPVAWRSYPNSKPKIGASSMAKQAKYPETLQLMKRLILLEHG